jgi:hypothetical protein
MGEPQENNRQITKRELREAKVQMTASPPAGTSFIGFVPDAPPGYEPLVSPLGETVPPPPTGEQSAPTDGAAPDQ